MNQPTASKRAFLWSLFLILLLVILQVLLFSDSHFMGIDSNAFASEILKYYPLTAFSELLKIMGVAFFPLYLVSFLVFKTTQPLFKKMILLCFIISYLLYLSGSMLQYPSLYQEFYPLKWNQVLFKLSYYLNPFILKSLGIAFFVFALCIEKNLFSRILAVCLCIFLFFNYLDKTAHSQFNKLSQDKPNVILIGIDSFRSDHLRKEIVPEISLLKANPYTVSFNDHIVGIPRTFPSWMEIIHGKYSADTGIRHMFPGLAEQRRFTDSLVSIFKKKGYHTSVVSDFAGDIFPRFNSGYTEIDTPNFSLQSLTRMSLDQSFPFFLPFLTNSVISKFFPNLLENPCFSDPETLLSKSIHHIEQSNKPFFLTMFFSTAHFPYAAPWPWYSKKSDPNYRGPYFFKKDPDLSQSHEVSNHDIEQIRSLYSGSLSAIDSTLGKFFQYLKNTNLWDNSLIIITADHGEDLFEFEKIQGHGDHLRGENVLKVPLLIKVTHKNGFPETKDLNFTTRMIDVAPTLAKLSNIETSSFVGKDLSPWIQNQLPEPELYAYSETEIWFSRTGRAFFQKERLDYPNISSLLVLDPGQTGAIVLNPLFDRVINTAKHRSLIRGAFKIIYTPTPYGAYFKLFNRLQDPENIRDISESNPETFTLMKKQLVEQMLNLESDSKILENYVVGH
jgi:hypothetical protein